MPIGDDFYGYTITFDDDGGTVGVGMNRTFVRVVLGCDGHESAQRACIEENRSRLIEEALQHRSDWFKLHDGRRVCMLGLSGVPELDGNKRFDRLGWPATTTSEHRGAS
jgi:hypothetical protein